MTTMTNHDVRRLLEADALPYEPERAMEERILRVQALAHALPIRRRAPTRAYSLARQLETQIRYLPKWFYAFHLLFVLFSLLLSFNNVLDDNVLLLYALFPLILLPYGLLLRQTFLSEMLELESACKYNISRTLAMRFFVLGCTAILAVTTAFLPLSLLRFAGILPVGYNLPDVLAALANFTVTAALILFCGLRRIRWGLLAGAAWYAAALVPSAFWLSALPAGFLACLLAASLLLFAAAGQCRARLRVRLDNTFYRGGM